MTKYVAGWNRPGMLESDPERFDSFADAVAYLLELVDQFWTEDLEDVGELPDVRAVIDARWKEVYDALKEAATEPNGTSFTEYTGDGWYAFWITPTEEEEVRRSPGSGQLALPVTSDRVEE